MTHGTNPSYRFAVLKPHLSTEGSTQPITFRILENEQWMAFGVCHSKIIQSKQFQFDYTNTGHGAYMISLNGGVWSHIDSAYNNVIKVMNSS